MDEKPQVAFTDGITWSVIYPYGSISGVWEKCSMGFVDCPVITTNGADTNKVHRIVQKLITPAGVSDLKALLRALEEIGCEISLPIKFPACEEISVSSSQE
jgi:hypothetical protein